MRIRIFYVCGIASLILGTTGCSSLTSTPGKIDRSLFSVLVDALSPEDRFRLMKVTTSGGISEVLVGARNNEGSWDALRLYVTRANDEVGVRSSSLKDESTAYSREENRLSATLVAEIFGVAVSDTRCMGNLAGSTGALPEGSIVFETEGEGVSVTFTYSQYNLGGSASCLYRISPVDLIKQLVVE